MTDFRFSPDPATERDMQDVRDRLASRVEDLHAMVSLVSGDVSPAGERFLKDYGYWPVEPDDCPDVTDAAWEIAGSYLLSADVYYRRGDRDFEPARVELLLACGGPTERITWDVRGPGWSEFSYSWADPDTCPLENDAWDVVESFIRTFIVED